MPGIIIQDLNSLGGALPPPRSLWGGSAPFAPPQLYATAYIILIQPTVYFAVCIKMKKKNNNIFKLTMLAIILCNTYDARNWFGAYYHDMIIQMHACFHTILMMCIVCNVIDLGSRRHRLLFSSGRLSVHMSEIKILLMPSYFTTIWYKYS